VGSERTEKCSVTHPLWRGELAGKEAQRANEPRSRHFASRTRRSKHCLGDERQQRTKQKTHKLQLWEEVTEGMATSFLLAFAAISLATINQLLVPEK